MHDPHIFTQVYWYIYMWNFRIYFNETSYYTISISFVFLLKIFIQKFTYICTLCKTARNMLTGNYCMLNKALLCNIVNFACNLCNLYALNIIERFCHRVFYICAKINMLATYKRTLSPYIFFCYIKHVRCRPYLLKL